MLRFIDLEGAYKAADKALGGVLPGRPASPLDDAVKLQDAEDLAQERMKEREAEQMMEKFAEDAKIDSLLKRRGLPANESNWKRYQGSQEM